MVHNAGPKVVAKRKIRALIKNRIPLFQYKASHFTNETDIIFSSFLRIRENHNLTSLNLTFNLLKGLRNG